MIMLFIDLDHMQGFRFHFAGSVVEESVLFVASIVRGPCVLYLVLSVLSKCAII